MGEDRPARAELKERFDDIDRDLTEQGVAFVFGSTTSQETRDEFVEAVFANSADHGATREEIRRREEEGVQHARYDLRGTFATLVREQVEGSRRVKRLLPDEVTEAVETGSDVDPDQPDAELVDEFVERSGVDDAVADRFREALEGKRDAVGPTNDFLAQALNETAVELRNSEAVESELGEGIEELVGLFAGDDPDAEERYVADARDLALVLGGMEPTGAGESGVFKQMLVAGVESPEAVSGETEANDRSEGVER